MDSSDLTLIGQNGYCSQEMVNMMMFGSAVSNTFDGNLVLDKNGTSHVSVSHETLAPKGYYNILLFFSLFVT